MTDSRTAPQRLIARLSGDAEGNLGQRLLHYGFRSVIGAVAGFFIVAMAASPRGGGSGQHFPLAFYLGGIGGGALIGLALAGLPRWLHPADWPTREEFRRGAEAKRAGASGAPPADKA